MKQLFTDSFSFPRKFENFVVGGSLQDDSVHLFTAQIAKLLAHGLLEVKSLINCYRN